ncbi:hypothetical protein D3C80_2108780 [compost metagenome]
MLRTYPDILQHLWIVMWYLPTAHGCTDVVVRNPHLIANNSRAIVVDLNGAAAIISLRDRKQPPTGIFRKIFSATT